MGIALISPESADGEFLRSAGFPVLALRPEAVPSLTALLFDHNDITGLVIRDGETACWSVSHVLSAAKLLERSGVTVLLGGGTLTRQCESSPLIRAVEEPAALPAVLRKKPKSDGHGKPPADSASAQAERADRPERIFPLSIPQGKLLMLGVVGSQRRIGCTTQAVGLWHYCRALGFDPAVVASPGEIARIAGPMDCREIPGGCAVEGIPFVTGTALSYDCYILDIGAGSVPEALKAADFLVLVAGSKPWELGHTAAALRAAGKAGLGILLSFTAAGDAAGLLPLFGGRPAAAAPWMPELWRPSAEALRVYDGLLRPELVRILAQNEELRPEPEPELTKEVN